jgi:outer membrane protein assembly factor BamA
MDMHVTVVLIISLCFFLRSLASAAPDQTGTPDLTVRSVRVEGLQSVPREEILYLLSLEPGTRADRT